MAGDGGWGEATTAGSTVGGSGSSSSGNWWDQTPSAPSAPTPTLGTVEPTGRFSIDVSSPGGLASSAQQNKNALEGLISGIGDALFGQKTGLINSVPIIGSPIGDAVRWATTQAPVLSQIAGAPAAVAGGAFGLAENVLSRVPLGWLPGGTDQTFDALPDSPEKRAIADLANRDVLYGANLKYDYIRQMQDQQPNLFPEAAAGIPGSLGGALVSGFTLAMSALGRTVERGVAGLTGPNGLNRLSEVMQLAKDRPRDLTPTEAVVVKEYGSGSWTENQALDFLAGRGAGFAHDALPEIALALATDPLVWASFGAAGLAKAGAKAASAAEAGIELTGRQASLLAAQRSSLAPLFKSIRTAIDPLSYFGGDTLAGKQIIDATTKEARIENIHVAWGEGNAVQLRDTLAPTGIMDQVMANLAWGIDNIRREFIVSKGGDNLMRTAGFDAVPEGVDVARFGEALIGKTQVAMPKQLFNDFGTFLHRVREVNVNVGDLADRMAASYGHDSAYWKPVINALGDEARSMLHLATYNADEDALLKVVRGLTRVEKATDPARIVLGNPRHLKHEEAIQLVRDIAAEPKAADKMRVLSEAVRRYDNLIGMFRYKPDDVAGSLERALAKLDDMITHEDLPRAMTDAEINRYPALRAWVDAHPNRDLAFRPPDERLARVVRDSEGNPTSVNLWAGHVSGNAPFEYIPGFTLPRNLAGMPVVERVAQRVQKPLDWVEVSLRSLRQQVSGSAIQVNARSRLAKALERDYGITPEESRALMDALDERAGLNKSTIRALSFSDMWDAIRKGATGTADILPMRVRPGLAAMRPLTTRDFGLAVLKAYEGDLRFVGLTQKFTGAMKTRLAQFPGLADFHGGNFAGQFSEKFYQMLRFTFHPMFQAQEAVEGWVLNAQRGVSPFLRGAMTEADRETARLWENIVNSRVIGMTDFDMVEYSEWALAGGRIGKVIGELPNAVPTLALDTPGGAKWIARQKRINYLRLWQTKLGPEIRDALGEDRFLAFKQVWGLANDNEVAIRWLTEMMDQTMAARITPQGLMDFKQLIADREKWMSMELGSLHPLQLDTLAYNIGQYDSVAGLRTALKRGTVSWKQVEEQLTLGHASPEYIMRAKHAIEFDLGQFYSDVREAYHLTDPEYRTFRSAIEASARLRGLNPVEYLSGVVAPQIRKVAVGDLAKSQEIKDTVAFLRAPSRAKGSQADALYAELAAAFKPHLDPSGVEVLRQASGIKGRWGVKHNQWLGEQMRAYLEGAVPASPDVERELRFMGKWTNDAGNVLRGVGTPEWRAIMEQTAKLDTAGGVPYNFTEHLTINSVIERIKALEQDAYRTHYFKRTRSVLERSVNHPFFGLYPASYMWGKILPEMIRFIAKEPFGLRTGALAYGMNDIRMSITQQREYDPKFDKMMSDVGRSPSIIMLGYMLPAVPWDIPAVAPGWLRALADAGQANAQRRAKGLPPVNIDPFAPLAKVADYLNPIGQDVAKLQSVSKELQNTILGTPQQQKQRGGPQVSIGPVKIGGSGQPTPIETLTPVVEDNLQLLQQWLSGGKFD